MRNFALRQCENGSAPGLTFRRFPLAAINRVRSGERIMGPSSIWHSTLLPA